VADNNLRSGRDPLAELARLIAQGAHAERASSDADGAPRSSATHVDRAAQVFSTRDDQMNERHSHVGEQDTPSPPLAPSCSHAVQEHGYNKASAGSRYFSWLAAQLNGSRGEPTPNQRHEAAQLPLGHQLPTSATSPAYETAPERSYETADEHRYHDEECAADQDYTDVESTHRRRSLVLVLTVLGLAIVGTAGVFGYGAIFGVPPTPISKGDKIAPVLMEEKNATNTNQAGTTTGSSEDLVSPEEHSAKPEPRMIRTIPIMPDQGWLRGAAAPTPPGAVQMVPNQAMPGPTSVWPPPPAIAAPPAPTAAAPIPAPPAKVLSEPMKIHADTNRADQSDAPDAKPESLAPAAPITLGKADGTAPEAPSVSGSGYVVQVTSERSESNAQAALQALQVKYPNLLSGRQPIIRRVDLGAKGIYYRVLVSPFASVEEAAGLCSRLKAAGSNCIVQRN
jgi:SPOR domain